jgi:hypothetical protein
MKRWSRTLNCRTTEPSARHSLMLTVSGTSSIAFCSTVEFAAAQVKLTIAANTIDQPMNDFR